MDEIVEQLETEMSPSEIFAASLFELELAGKVRQTGFWLKRGGDRWRTSKIREYGPRLMNDIVCIRTKTHIPERGDVRFDEPTATRLLLVGANLAEACGRRSDSEMKRFP